jgi:tripartite-type tricarboxylate transporter receptor subunit TctC
VGRSLPARNVQELVALARQKPGELNYASIGIGSAPHLGAELFKSVAKVDITHVPYRGSSAQAIAALIAGDVSMFLVGTSTAVPYIQSGAVQGLAVTSSHRVQGLPDVPTFAEAGLPGVDVSIWFAVLVPGGTPAAIVGKLSADIAQVVAERARPSSWRIFWTRTTSSSAISSRSSVCRWNDAAAGRYARSCLSCEAGLATLTAGHDIFQHETAC